ncbi:hypothetical protein [Streptomyces phaeolivaceus]|nr:hypothetical protein [Streptomyces phaeolivaceus]
MIQLQSDMPPWDTVSADTSDAEGTDLLELLNAAGENDRGTENPFR